MKDVQIATPNIFKKASKAILFATVAISLSFLVSCGSESTSYCIPNFTQGGVGMKVTYLVGSLNEFQFQICYNDNFRGSQASVYGVQFESDISSISTTTDIRQAHISDGLYPGQTFSVTFNSNDAWFVIYEDDTLGNLDTTSEILRGEFR